MNAIENLAVNSIRILSADAIQKANSGHPGLPLGCAAAAYEHSEIARIIRRIRPGRTGTGLFFPEDTAPCCYIPFFTCSATG